MAVVESTPVAQAPGQTAQPLASRELVGRPALTLPTRTYAVTNNPFAVAAVLPAIVATFIAAEIALIAGLDHTVLAGAALFITVALLLIPAVALKGSLTMTNEGIAFERGKDRMTASWRDISGLSWRQDCGLCLSVHNQQQSKPTWKLPGGFNAVQGDSAQIPLRMFGDRQFSVLYDVRDRLPETATMPALERASSRDSIKMYVYGGVVLLDVVALAITAWVYQP